MCYPAYYQPVATCRCHFTHLLLAVANGDQDQDSVSRVPRLSLGDDSDNNKTETSLDDCTFIEQNGKFRIATNADLRPAAANSPAARCQSARSPRQNNNNKRSSLLPRPPATARSAAATDRSRVRHQRTLSARYQSLSARGSKTLSKQDLDERRAKAEEEEKRKARLEEADSAFKAWLRQKRSDAVAKKNREQIEANQTSSSVSRVGVILSLV